MDPNILPANDVRPSLNDARHDLRQSGTLPTVSPQQLQWLMERLSSDDQKELKTIMSDCTSEMTLNRGLPVACGAMFSMWYARNKLPKKYWIGPKASGPFYFLVGIGSLCATNLLSMNTCAERVRPKIQMLYEKYSNGAPDRYSELRQRHRHGLSVVPAISGYPQAVETPPGEIPTNRSYVWDEQVPILSGTPTSDGSIPASTDAYSGSSLPTNTKSNTSYGDKDFS